ncbi:hypothetical protein FDO65_10735 [Nakamurella flava]|uniref:Pr6Pr family membrane protein n=1 Tax=Nakamurella flava TaxID=2576308 RepID=A0A4U6QND8_9ACTN|nr:Pr6Pr family membrane protein [Nakamurella flava]TKV61971.1 hypothetical protein FDO65_10735 [Nakamurella flava]
MDSRGWGVRTGWTMLIAALAWTGVLLAMDGELSQLRYFSQVSTAVSALVMTAVAITLIARRRPGRVLDWCRGAATVYGIVTLVVYQVLLSGNLSELYSLLEHAVVPVLMVLDWLLFRARLPWWSPVSWLLPPIAYLGVYYPARTSSGRSLYPFLDPAQSNFWTWVVILLAVFAVVGLAACAAGRLGASRDRPRTDRPTTLS